MRHQSDREFGNRWCGNESAIGDAINWNVQPILPDMRTGKWVNYHFNLLIPKLLHTVRGSGYMLKEPA